MKSTAKKIATIFVVSTDLPDYENFIFIVKIEKVCSAIHVLACMYVCMFMEVCVCICIAAGHVCMKVLLYHTYIN